MMQARRGGVGMSAQGKAVGFTVTADSSAVEHFMQGSTTGRRFSMSVRGMQKAPHTIPKERWICVVGSKGGKSEPVKSLTLLLANEEQFDEDEAFRGSSG